MASKGSGICVVSYDEQQKLTTSIRNTINESFTDLSSCLAFIEQQSQEEKALILITTTLDENILLKFESKILIEAILIFSSTEKDIETCPSKVLGVYPQAESLLRALSQLFDNTEQQLDIRSFLSKSQQDGKDNIHFFFYNLWKNYTKDQTSTKQSLADQSRIYFQSYNQIKSTINDFETSYRSNDVLSWFDIHRHPFPYYLLLANALRRHDQEVLSLARFFLHDLSKQMKSGNIGQVYLGTKLPSSLINRFEQQTKTDVIAFQSFLRVTRSRADALLEASQPCRRHKMANVLFKIDLNDALYAIRGDKIYLDMGIPFYVSCVTKSDNGSSLQLLTIVKLIALNKNEREQLYEQFLQRQTKAGRTIEDLFRRMTSDISDDEALADEYIARGEWSQAASVLSRIPDPNVRILNKHGCLLREHLKDISGALKLHQQALKKATSHEKAETLVYLGVVYNNLTKFDQALKVFNQALEWFENEKQRDFPFIARCLIGLGNAKSGLEEFDDALDYAERALAIREHQVKPRNDFDIAACLGNIGNILHGMGDIQRALDYAKRAVDLLGSCRKDDFRLAAALNNLGAMHETNHDFVKAREYFERALKCLPDEHHPYRESTLANIAALDQAEKENKTED